MARFILLLGLLSPAAAQSTGLLTLFLPDSEPLSLEASAIAVNTVGTAPRADTITTLEVACPTAASPENDACRSAGIYPAQVYHTQGSVWGGTTTHTADDSTTTWVCALGNIGRDYSGNCNKTIVAGGSTRTETAAYGNCYVHAHQLPVVVTAGVEKINPYHFLDGDASQYVSIKSSVIAADGCPSSQPVIWAGGAASTIAATNSAALTASLSNTGSPAATTTPPTQTPTSAAATAATTSGSPNGAGRAGKDPMAGLMLGMGLTVLLWAVL